MTEAICPSRHWQHARSLQRRSPVEKRGMAVLIAIPEFPSLETYDQLMAAINAEV